MPAGQIDGAAFLTCLWVFGNDRHGAWRCIGPARRAEDTRGAQVHVRLAYQIVRHSVRVPHLNLEDAAGDGLAVIELYHFVENDCASRVHFYRCFHSRASIIELKFDIRICIMLVELDA